MRATPFIATMAVAGAISAATVGGAFAWQEIADVDTTSATTTTTVLEVPGPPGEDGADGRDGVDGEDGIDAIDGADGQDGTNGRNGIDGEDGADGVGIDGADGINGEDGADSTVPGPMGPPGADSTVPGPPGPQGVQGIPGPVPEMVRGNVADDGTPVSGVGYASVRLSPGRYEIIFVTPFTAPPTMLATKIFGSPDVDAGLTVGFGEITVDQITTTGAIIATSTSGGALVDSAFGFMALGDPLVP